MPLTQELLQQPDPEEPYNRGKVFKRGTTWVNMGENERIFIFKHRTLFWVKDKSEEYPRGRIRFDESFRMKREDAKSIKFKTPRREYVLRAESKCEADQWFCLFKQALRMKRKGTDSAIFLANGAQDVNEQKSSVERTPVGAQHADANFEFAYGFLRDIVCEQMHANQRMQLHTNAQNYIAECLETQTNDRDKLSILHTRHIQSVLRYSEETRPVTTRTRSDSGSDYEEHEGKEEGDEDIVLAALAHSLVVSTELSAIRVDE